MHVHSPLLRSTPWSARRGVDVWLKLDCVQPSGSFKIRGLGNAARRAVEAGATGLLSSSGGNAGLAAAYAARQLGVPITVIVPSRTSALMRDRIAAEGAEVIRGEALGDHETLSDTLLRRLEAEAEAAGAQLVTTEKDAARLSSAWRTKVLTLVVRLQVGDWTALDARLAALGL